LAAQRRAAGEQQQKGAACERDERRARAVTVCDGRCAVVAGARSVTRGLRRLPRLGPREPSADVRGGERRIGGAVEDARQPGRDRRIDARRRLGRR
jgi:hypothetical protein